MRRVIPVALIFGAVLIVVAAAALALVRLHGGLNSASPTTSTRAASPLCANWAITPLAHGDGAPDLYGVAAIATDDVWAVGTSGDTRGVALHWDGSRWTRVQTPNLGAQVTLRSVAAASSTDVWAVGSYATSEQSSIALIEHWNGTQWSVASAADATAGQQNFLDGVAAVTSSDVWAVGTTGFNNTQPLMLHWNGVVWAVISGPQAPYASELSGVAGVSGDDVWAVGSSGGSGPSTLAEHWDGSRWQIVPVPDGPTGGGALNSVVARASGDVWAVGYGVSFPAGISLTEHWDGHVWQVVSSPSPDSQGANSLTGVAVVLGGGTLWAVGATGAGAVVVGNANAAYLVEEWNGGAWNAVPAPGSSTPSASVASGNLYGVAATPIGDVWVVGAGGIIMLHTGPITRARLACHTPTA